MQNSNLNERRRRDRKEDTQVDGSRQTTRGFMKKKG
jgi:hypothetical protein